LQAQVDLWTNFDDYRLQAPVGLLRADAHTMPFRCGATLSSLSHERHIY